MIIYEVCAVVPYEGAIIKWAGDKGEAVSIQLGLALEHGVQTEDIAITKFVVPNGKAGLLSWLNEHV